jgi:hypothetical protein
MVVVIVEVQSFLCFVQGNELFQGAFILGITPFEGVIRAFIFQECIITRVLPSVENGATNILGMRFHRR